MTKITAPAASPVSPTAMKPGYDVTLTDGSNTVGFVVVDPEGDNDYTQLRNRPIDQMAIQMSQENSKYGDRRWPFQVEAFEDASGGRGGQRFADDRSKFYYSRNLDTLGGKITLGGRPTYTSLGQIIRAPSSAWAGKVDLHTARKYFAKQFTCPAATISITLRAKHAAGSGTSLKASIYSNSAGAPGTEISAGASIGSTGRNWDNFRWTFTGLTPSTTYWVVLTSNGSSTDYFSIFQDGGTGAVASTLGAWTPSIYEPVMLIAEVPDDNRVVKFFEYKGQLYAYTVPDRPSMGARSSIIYMNGDRGTATSNSSDLSRLNDTSKTWTTNEWVGCYVALVSGSEEDRAWRKVSSNGSNYLVVDKPWKFEHGYNSPAEYVILGSNKWTALFDTGVPITGHTVIDDYVFFSAVSSNVMYMRGYTNASSAWTTSIGNTSIICDIISSYYNQNDNHSYLMAYSHSGALTKRSQIERYEIIPFGGAGGLANVVARLGGNGERWEEYDLSGTYGRGSFGILAAFSTGIFTVMNLDQPVSMRNATEILIGLQSDTAITSGHLLVYLSDAKDLGKWFSPKGFFYKESHEYHLPEKVAFYNTSHTVYDKLFDGDPATEEAISMTSSTYMYIGSKLPFDKIKVDVGSTVNSAADTTITGKFEFWNGSEWIQVAGTITDGTLTSTYSHNKDGTISFTEPGLWEPRIIASHWGTGITPESLYYIRFGSSNSWTASVKFVDYRVANTRAYKPKVDMVDGDTTTYDTLADLTATDYIYICHSEKFNQIDFLIGTVNSVVTTSTLEYFNGSRWVTHDINDGTLSSGKTLGADGIISLKEPVSPYGTDGVPVDWEPSAVNGVEGYWVRIKPGTDLTANLTIEEVRIRRFAPITTTCGAISANTPTVVSFSIPANQGKYLQDYMVESIGLAVDSNYGLVGITITQQPMLVNFTADPIIVPDQINGMQMYTSQADSSASLWLFGRTKVFEYRPEEGKVVPFMLGELGELGGSALGNASAVNGVYLFFTLGDKLQRYYSNNLDDIGPDRDEVIDDIGDRSGPISSIASYPGRLYIAVNAGVNSGTSSIMVLSGNGWHDVYQAPQPGDEITSIYHQNIEGSPYGRMWISQGNEVLWIPVAINPGVVTSFPYAYDGFIVLPWIDLGMSDVRKAFRSMEIFCEGTGGWFEMDYRLTRSAAWTDLSTVFDTEPSEEAVLSAAGGVNARQMQIRIRFETTTNNATPKLVAAVLRAFGVVPVKYEHTWSSLLADQYVYVTLDGKAAQALGKGTIDSVYAILNNWVDSATVLTMNTRSKLDNAKSVVMQGLVKRPFVKYAKESKTQNERWIIDVAVSEI